MNNLESQRWTVIGVFALVVAVRIYVALESGMRGVDDAFITYRYAENIAANLGFVYNSNQHVLGVTTPLYTILLSFLALLQIPIPFASQALGIIASGAIGALLYLYSRRIIPGPACIAPALLYVFWPNAINTDISGMEVTLFVLGALSFFYALLIGRYRPALVIASLAALLRPEGVILILLFFLFKFTLNQKDFRRHYLPELVIVFAILAPWIIFATAYFGSPIPNSISAKLALYGALENAGAVSRIAELLNLTSALGWVVFLGAIWGVVYSLMRIYWGWLEGMFFVSLLCGLALSDSHIFFWYKAPLTLMLTLFLGIGAAGLIAIAGNVIKNRIVLQITMAIVIITAIPVVGNRFARTLEYNKEEASIYKIERRRAGEFIDGLAKQENEDIVLVAEDIGYPGYYYRGIMIDRDGLTSPEAIEWNSDENYVGFLEKCLEQYPKHWLAFNSLSPTAAQILESGILTNRYQLVSNFASAASQNYLLYRALPRKVLEN